MQFYMQCETCNTGAFGSLEETLLFLAMHAAEHHDFAASQTLSDAFIELKSDKFRDSNG